ncbi:Xanthine dehydrogenase [Folsomia candida]|uniref:Xanthine dehydrogenase n=1 Tax=Folsomia candida TaxID=158441 RepID=A0A226EL58_FOLCA|nr:Xanthine dehydrogenase [Folsomia candida]
MSTFQFFVNGDWIEFDDFDVDWSLAHALRDRLGLTGTKIACGVGGCGSCTVLVSRFNKHSQSFRHFPVNACITPIYSVYGCHILTVEGLGSSDKKLVEPIQDAMVRGNSTQCGFCSPGIVMSVFAFQNQLRGDATMSDIKTALQGNLCRCTGYRPILDAIQQCSKQCSECPEPCSENTNDIEDQVGNNLIRCQRASQQDPQFEEVRKVDTSSKKVFNIEKLIVEFVSTQTQKKSLQFETPFGNWFVPRNLKKLKSLLPEYPKAKLVGGCTSKPIQLIPKGFDTYDTIDLCEIEELKIVKLEDSCLNLGAALTISEAEFEVDNIIKILPDEQASILKCLKNCFHSFGSAQIRNVATIGGSLSNPSNYSDLQTFCNGFGVVVSYLKLSDDDDVNNQRIISHIGIPLTYQKEKVWFEKISRRTDCAPAILNVAIKHVPDSETTLTFGGLAIQRFKTCLEGLESSENFSTLEEQIQLNFVRDSLHDLKYIQVLAKNILLKFKEWVDNGCSDNNVQESNFKSTQLFQHVEVVGTSNDLVHRSVPHASAYKHVTGEAKFCDDVTKFHNELEMGLVLSTKAHAKIVNIDYTKALELDGVVGYVCSQDLSSDCNKFGLIERDEEIFSSEKVTARGQIICGILANDRSTAKRAVELVTVEYEEISPVILTNEDAINHNSYYENHGSIMKDGDCKPIFETSPNVVSSEVKIGSQEHFYMEAQSCIAIPKGEDGEMELISSTQNPTGVQMQVAQCLNVPANRITVKVKRIGGGFGGKEVRCLLVALPCAVAAKKFGKPVRCILDRETDMRVSGKRHFYLSKQKIAFSDEGKLQALEISVYANAGNSLDVSMAPIERVMLNLDNAYKIHNFDYKGYVCKTNIPSNSVMRGTGAPQAAFLAENIMDTIAATLGKDPVEVKQSQLYNEGDYTHYGQKLDNCNVRKCWEQCLQQSNYFETRAKINEFNSQNKYLKRGISMNPCHYGVGYTALHLNQGSALVHIYTDGSVLITHGGVELGQGVHSKMTQIATRELGIAASKIRITETSTDKVPNTTPSSASVTSDVNGMAVMNACRELVARLQPYWIENPDNSWEEMVNKAYMDRVSLTATGFHKDADMGWDGKRGSPWNYFSTGTACTVVELNCLTGKFQILKTNIVMDVGQSLNPGIDIGQIEGAFVQGIGLFMLEEVIINENGELISADPSTYHIPTSSDVPQEFNVTLLTGSANPKAVYSSKTVGEPPILLATSVFFAVKDAIRSYRKSIGAELVFDMDSPATIQKILMACQKTNSSSDVE